MQLQQACPKHYVVVVSEAALSAKDVVAMLPSFPVIITVVASLFLGLISDAIRVIGPASTIEAPFKERAGHGISQEIACADPSTKLKSRGVQITGATRIYPVAVNGYLRLKVESDMAGSPDGVADASGKATIICDSITLQTVRTAKPL